VPSPGVPPDAAPLAAARAAGVPLLAELELGWRALTEAGSRFIVITGTNGKSTTTALASQVLDAAGIAAVAAGNIGRPLLDVALGGPAPAWVVAEASSFQLHDCPTLAPEIGVVTNLAPNHLDRYPDVAAYYADKARLFATATAGSTWVLNADDPAVPGLAGTAPGRRRTFGFRATADARYDTTRDLLLLDGTPLLPRAELPLIGAHNVANALAAAIAAGLARATGLPHRLELVRTVDDVQWINDSKSTNVTSTVVALRALARPYLLLLGGRHKGEPYTRLAEAFDGRCRGVIAYGEAASRVLEDLAGRVPLLRVQTLDEAAEAAGERALPGDAVLLSPACSSYDQFTDYEARGAAFRRLAEAR